MTLSRERVHSFRFGSQRLASLTAQNFTLIVVRNRPSYKIVNGLSPKNFTAKKPRWFLLKKTCSTCHPSTERLREFCPSSVFVDNICKTPLTITICFLFLSENFYLKATVPIKLYEYRTRRSYIYCSEYKLTKI